MTTTAKSPESSKPALSEAAEEAKHNPNAIVQGIPAKDTTAPVQKPF